jgi:hypothetical protein
LEKESRLKWNMECDDKEIVSMLGEFDKEFVSMLGRFDLTCSLNCALGVNNEAL